MYLALTKYHSNFYTSNVRQNVQCCSDVQGVVHIRQTYPGVGQYWRACLINVLSISNLVPSL